MSTRERFDADLTAALRDLRAAGLLRQMRLPGGIDLVSNDYLGMAEHPGLIRAMRDALSSLPAGSGGSRLLRGHHRAFDEAEHKLAAYSGTPAALLFGSGYAANIGLLQAVIEARDLIVSDELNHASLIDGIRLSKAPVSIYRHQDLEGLERALRQPRAGRAFVVTESVFSMDGDLTPLAEICEIAERHDAYMLVDEAHATGLYGARGSGRVEELGLRDRIAATIHTGGKALGVGGAWVAGSTALRDLLVNRARSFVFSTAPMPLLPTALSASLDLLEREPFRRVDVHRKTAMLRAALADAGVSTLGASPIVPIIIGSNDAAISAQANLTDAGFDVRAIRPPSVPPGTARLRVTTRYPVADGDLLRFASQVARLHELSHI